MTGAGDGFQVGAGVSTRPFAEEKHELQGNGLFNRVERYNGFGFDVDYLYNFTPPSGGGLTPFAAAGLNLTHYSVDCSSVDCGSTDTALQIGGGIKKPMASGREVFGEIYFLLSDGNPIVVRGGIGW